MGKTDPRIDAYIAKSADFAKPILNHLRKLVHTAYQEYPSSQLAVSSFAFLSTAPSTLPGAAVRKRSITMPPSPTNGGLTI
jgi:hypothetical protein